MEFFNGIYFTRLVHDWEVDFVSSFFELLYSIVVFYHIEARR